MTSLFGEHLGVSDTLDLVVDAGETHWDPTTCADGWKVLIGTDDRADEETGWRDFSVCPRTSRQ